MTLPDLNARTPERLNAGRPGSALITTMILIMMLEMVGAAILTLSQTSLRVAEHVRRSTLAFNAAESGAERAARWMKDQGTPPTGTTAIDPFGGAQTLDTGTYTASILPDAGNSGAVLKTYTATVTGTVQGRSQSVELVLRESSFGKYAYFTDAEVNSINAGRIWFFSGDRIRGPAHSNNTGGSNFQISWDSSAANPIFEGMLTAAGSSIDYSPSAPATPSEFLKVYRTGTRGYQLGVDPIPLPSSSDKQKNAAWGSGSGFPTTTGVSIPANGGIYICGDASIVMQLDGSGNQQFVVTQGSTTTTITVDRVNNQISKKIGSGPPTVTAGVGNGVLFCSGNITSLSGTIADNRLDTSTPPNILARSAYTIATDVNAGNNITVTGTLKYNSAPDSTLPTTDPTNLRPGTLGLVARNVIVSSSAPTAMEIDAVMLSGSSSTSDGSFYVSNYSTKTPTGTLKIVGGIIQKARGAVGTLQNGSLHTGYAKDYWYDPRLADNPPPYFPTTGTYDRISWRKLSG